MKYIIVLFFSSSDNWPFVQCGPYALLPEWALANVKQFFYTSSAPPPPQYLDHKGGCWELTFLLCTSSKGNSLQLFHRRLLCFGMCFSIDGWYKSLGESSGVLGLVGRSLVQQLLCGVHPINQYWVLTVYTHDTRLSENCSTSAIGRLQPEGISNMVWSVHFLMLWLECGVSPLYSDLVMLHLKDHPLASCTSLLLPLQYISSWLQSSSCSDGMYAHFSQRQTHHSSKNCLTCLLQKSIFDNVCENLPGGYHSKNIISN